MQVREPAYIYMHLCKPIHDVTCRTRTLTHACVRMHPHIPIYKCVGCSVTSLLSIKNWQSAIGNWQLTIVQSKSSCWDQSLSTSPQFIWFPFYLSAAILLADLRMQAITVGSLDNQVNLQCYGSRCQQGWRSDYVIRNHRGASDSADRGNACVPISLCFPSTVIIDSQLYRRYN